MCKWTRVCIRPARLRPGVWRSLKSSVGPAVLKKPRIVVYLIYQKSGLQLLNTRRAAFLCNYNTKPVRSAFQYFDWKSLMEIAFSQQKILILTFFDTCYRTKLRGNVFTAGCRNHACCTAVKIASKHQYLGNGTTMQYGSVNFLVCLLNKFEQVPVPGLTENRYLTVRRTWGWLS